jgi:hypothetical protein
MVVHPACVFRKLAMYTVFTPRVTSVSSLYYHDMFRPSWAIIIIHCRHANLTRIYHSNLCWQYCSTSCGSSHCFTEIANQFTCYTKLMINFFYLMYYLRYLITKSLPLNHLVVYCLTNSNGFFRLSGLGIFCTLRSLDTSLLIKKFYSCNSAVGVATDYGPDDWGVGVWAPVGSRIFASRYSPDQLWGPTQPPIQWVWGFFPQGCEAEHSPPTNAKVKKRGSINPLSHISPCHSA